MIAAEWTPFRSLLSVAPFGDCKIVVPGPEPRRTMHLLRLTGTPACWMRNVPAPRSMNLPEGHALTVQALIAAWICAVSSDEPPTGVSVEPHCTDEAGMPPTLRSPAFDQLA